MANPIPTFSIDPPAGPDAAGDDSEFCACVMSFNANDASGAAGLACDILSIASVGAHGLPVNTGVYIRDSAEVSEHFSLDAEAIESQARRVLEDIQVQAFKVGFVGSTEAVSVIAEICADYADVPVVAYMPNLSWWDALLIDDYLDAFTELMLPQTTVLVGNHSTLWRWLLPDWSSEKSPSARDLAKAAADHGVPYTLVTGIALPDQWIDNVLASPTAALGGEKFERFEAIFTGAGDTLSAILAALVANGDDLVEATQEALVFLDRSLDAGFRPGMGHVVPDRMFWAQPETEDADLSEDEKRLLQTLEMPTHETRH